MAKNKRNRGGGAGGNPPAPTGGPRPPGGNPPAPAGFRRHEHPEQADIARIHDNEWFPRVQLERDPERPGGYRFKIKDGIYVHVPVRVDNPYHDSKSLEATPVAVKLTAVDHASGEVEGLIIDPAQNGTVSDTDRLVKGYVERTRRTSLQFKDNVDVPDVTMKRVGKEFVDYYGGELEVDVFYAQGGKDDTGSDRDVPGSKDGRNILVYSFFGNSPDDVKGDVVITKGHEKALAYEAMIPWQRDLVAHFATATGDLQRSEPLMKALTANFDSTLSSLTSRAQQKKFGAARLHVLGAGKEVMNGFQDMMALIDYAEDDTTLNDVSALTLRTANIQATLQQALHRFNLALATVAVYVPRGSSFTERPFLGNKEQYKAENVGALEALSALLAKDSTSANGNMDEGDVAALEAAMFAPFQWVGTDAVAIEARGGEAYRNLISKMKPYAGIDPIVQFVPDGRGGQTGSTAEWIVDTTENHVHVLEDDHIVDIHVRNDGGVLRVTFDTTRARAARIAIREQLSRLLVDPSADEGTINQLMDELEALRPNDTEETFFRGFVESDRFTVVMASESEDEQNLVQKLQRAPLPDVIAFMDRRGPKIGKFNYDDLSTHEALRRQVVEIVEGRIRDYTGVKDPSIRIWSPSRQASQDGVHTFGFEVPSVTGTSAKRELDFYGNVADDAIALGKLRTFIEDQTGVPVEPPDTRKPIELHEPYNLLVGQAGEVLDPAKLAILGDVDSTVRTFTIVDGPEIVVGGLSVDIDASTYAALQNDGAIRVTEGPKEFEPSAEGRIKQFCLDAGITPPFDLGEAVYYRGVPATPSMGGTLIADQPLRVFDVKDRGASGGMVLRVVYDAGFGVDGRVVKNGVTIGDEDDVQPYCDLTPHEVTALLASGPTADTRLERVTNIEWYKTELQKGNTISGELLADALELPTEDIRPGVQQLRFRLPEPIGNIRVIRFDNSNPNTEATTNTKGSLLIGYEDATGTVIDQGLFPYSELIAAHERGLIEAAYPLEGDPDMNELTDLLRSRGIEDPFHLIEKINQRAANTVKLKDIEGIMVEVVTIKDGLVGFTFNNSLRLRTYTVREFLDAFHAPPPPPPPKPKAGEPTPPAEKKLTSDQIGNKRYLMRTAAAPAPLSDLRPIPVAAAPVAPTLPISTPGSSIPAPPLASAPVAPRSRPTVVPHLSIVPPPTGPRGSAPVVESTPASTIPELRIPSGMYAVDLTKKWVDNHTREDEYERGILDAGYKVGLYFVTHREDKRFLLGLPRSVAEEARKIQQHKESYIGLRRISHKPELDERFLKAIHKEQKLAVDLDSFYDEVGTRLAAGAGAACAEARSLVNQLRDVQAELLAINFQATTAMPSGIPPAPGGTPSPSPSPAAPAPVISPVGDRSRAITRPAARMPVLPVVPPPLPTLPRSAPASKAAPAPRDPYAAVPSPNLVRGPERLAGDHSRPDKATLLRLLEVKLPHGKGMSEFITEYATSNKADQIKADVIDAFGNAFKASLGGAKKLSQSIEKALAVFKEVEALSTQAKKKVRDEIEDIAPDLEDTLIEAVRDEITLVAKVKTVLDTIGRTVAQKGGVDTFLTTTLPGLEAEAARLKQKYNQVLK